MGKAMLSLFTDEPFASLLGSRHCTTYHHHLTKPAGLTSLNRVADSMSLYGHAACTEVKGVFKSQRSHLTLPI